MWPLGFNSQFLLPPKTSKHFGNFLGIRDQGGGTVSCCIWESGHGGFRSWSSQTHFANLAIVPKGIFPISHAFVELHVCHAGVVGALRFANAQKRKRKWHQTFPNITVLRSGRKGPSQTSVFLGSEPLFQISRSQISRHTGLLGLNQLLSTPSRTNSPSTLHVLSCMGRRSLDGCWGQTPLCNGAK